MVMQITVVNLNLKNWTKLLTKPLELQIKTFIVKLHLIVASFCDNFPEYLRVIQIYGNSIQSEINALINSLFACDLHRINIHRLTFSNIHNEYILTQN